jgi:hypothetical protein
MPPLTATEIYLSNWKRSLCKTIDYPAFDNQELVVLPDILTENMSSFSGVVCYETTFLLDSPKALTLEISNTAGGVEVFMNGETLGIKAKPPCYYDLSSLAWRGENYLAIEVAIVNKISNMTAEEDIPCIIGNVRLFSH